MWQEDKGGGEVKLIEDKAQQMAKHKKKNDYWKSIGVEVERVPVPVGDYIICNEKVQDVLDRKAKRGTLVKKMDLLGTFNISVDTKKDIQELIGDLCGKSHERFRDELILAQNNGVKLYILVENDGGWVDKKQTIWNKTITSLDDLHSWKNPRLFIWRKGKQLYPSATKGITLQKICKTCQDKYGCEFIFCSSKDAGKKVLELLGVEK